MLSANMQQGDEAFDPAGSERSPIGIVPRSRYNVREQARRARVVRNVNLF